MKQRMHVLHVADTLAVGGAENVLVLLVNELSRIGIETYVCATWRGGRLENRIAPGINVFILGRKNRFDFLAIIRLIKYNYQNKIDIIHAHSYSLFISVIVSFFPPYPKVIWHDHYGAREVRSTFWHFLFTRRCSAIICVKQELVDWVVNILKYSSKKVFYLDNPLYLKNNANVDSSQCFRGNKGYRIVCLANFRPQKDHITLLRAFRVVVDRISDAHLFLVGSIYHDEYYRNVCQEISQLNLTDHVSILGERDDIYYILSNCDIGVLSSEQEGLPLALLEYGFCNVAVIATQVGQIPKIIKNGVNGLLVKPKNPVDLANCIASYLEKPNLRKNQAKIFNKYVLQNHSLTIITQKVLNIYLSLRANRLER